MTSRTVALVGVGKFGGHILRRLVAEAKHKIVVLSRGARPDLESANVRVVQVDYASVDSLAAALTGVDTVINTTWRPQGLHELEINLITAAIRVGATRYAPTEWNTDTDRYPNKIAFYLEKEKFHAWVREHKPAISIAKFFTGMGTDYFGSTQAAAFLGLSLHRDGATATIVGDGDAPLTVSTGPDIAAYVAAYVNADDAVWAGAHGIESERTSWNKIVADFETVLGYKIARNYVPIEEEEKKLSDANPFVAWSASWQISMARGETAVQPTARGDFPQIKTTSVKGFLEANRANYD
eukprot:TRINITY_DN7047_c0_g1_i1.p2 TRINITY_DN7047_c0_g1~~TRINITY_DN7047_c0_g1_i1.p2  ORF type:complete len:296 (-),score=101.26 TRINITY_DN7047_c0_g1_i1:239-1126(-)